MIAKLRRSYREGYLLDALFGEEFIRAAIEALRQSATIEARGGTLSFRPTPAFLATNVPEKPAIRLAGQEQSNSSAMVEEWLIIKFYRKVASGTNPEIEMGSFLTNEAHFANSPALYGSIHLQDSAGNEIALGVAHAWIRNQGDGWINTLAYLDRFLQDRRVATAISNQARPKIMRPIWCGSSSLRAAPRNSIARSMSRRRSGFRRRARVRPRASRNGARPSCKR